MSRKAQRKPHGQIRQSQVVTTFGPGAMLDLPNHSVIVGGLDYWTGGGDEIIEPRLIDKLKRLLEVADASSSYAPPPDHDDPTAPTTGITAWQFPSGSSPRTSSRRSPARDRARACWCIARR